MAKLPKWRKEFNKRMAEQLRLFKKAKEAKLTNFTYTNGTVKVVPKKYYRSSWGHRTRDWRKERRMIGKPEGYERIWEPKHL